MRIALIAFIAYLCGTASAANAMPEKWAGQLMDPGFVQASFQANKNAERLITGIISYVRWPNSQTAGERMICLVGTPRFSGPLSNPLAAGGQAIRTLLTTPQTVAAGQHCDVLFLGRMPTVDRRRLIAWVRNRPVLTITDDDSQCAYGAMFCLQPRGAGLGFSINLDAIGRSRVRVDPRVLKIGVEGT